MDSFLGAQDGRKNPYYESESKEVRDPKFDLVARNLGRYRFYGPILTRAEERDLIGRAQAGDSIAMDRLIRSFARIVLKLAGKYYGPTRDELTAAGFIGLVEAINRFDLSSDNGLRAYAEPWIRKFIGEEAEGKFRPIAPQTITAHKAAKYQEYYSTTDYADDSDGTKGWDFGSDEPDRFQNPLPVFSAKGVISQWSLNSVRAPWNGRWWRISRSRRVYAPLQDGRAIEAAEWRRLLELGRRKRALELVADDKKRAERARHVLPVNTKPIPPAETLEKKASIPGEFTLLLAEKRARDLKRVTPTPQVRQLTHMENPCLTLHTNKLQATRSQKHSSPLRPELPKPPRRNLRTA